MSHHFIFIGLLSVLFLFKRTRYASFVYLVPYFAYMILQSNGWIPDGYYFSISAGLNTVICIALFKGYKFESINDIFNLNKYNINQKVGLLSILLIAINYVGYGRWVNSPILDLTVYQSDYRFIQSVQILLLYIGNMINAWADRRDHKLALVCMADTDYFKTPDEIFAEKTE